MSSVDRLSSRFNPRADVAAFYAGIGISPLSLYSDPNEAAEVLRLQLLKLDEEHSEVVAAARARQEDPMHAAEEGVDVAYVALGICELLGYEGDFNFEPSATTIEGVAIVPEVQILRLQEAYEAALQAHEYKEKVALGDNLLGLAGISFGLIKALGHCPEDLWDMKHQVNTTKYDADLYSAYRDQGLSHMEALNALKESWPERRKLLDPDSLPIDNNTGFLVA